MSRKRLSVRRQNFIAALPDDDLPLIDFSRESSLTPTPIMTWNLWPASVNHQTWPVLQTKSRLSHPRQKK